MKKFVLISAVLAVSLFAGSPCVAQQTESNHSIHANVAALNFHAGAGYSYEWAFAPKWTVVGSAWFKGEFSWGQNFFGGNYSTFILHPTISVEPRLYYNLGRRKARGRNTALNSGNYVSATVSCFFPSIDGRNGVYRDFYHFGIAPHWGMRRMYGGHFLLEFHAGVLVLMAPAIRETIAAPDVNLKLGFVF
jgi:hypothetical protein